MTPFASIRFISAISNSSLSSDNSSAVIASASSSLRAIRRAIRRRFSFEVSRISSRTSDIFSSRSSFASFFASSVCKAHVKTVVIRNPAMTQIRRKRWNDWEIFFSSCRTFLRSAPDRTVRRSPASITARLFTAIMGSEQARTNEKAVFASVIFVRKIISICMTSVIAAVARQ